MGAINRTRFLLTVYGFALTKARLAAGLGLDDVMQRLGSGLNKSTISRWERGQLQPSPERLFALVKLFGTADFVRLNDAVELTPDEVKAIRKLRKELIQEYVRLNGKAVLTAEEIEVVRKLREG